MAQIQFIIGSEISRVYFGKIKAFDSDQQLLTFEAIGKGTSRILTFRCLQPKLAQLNLDDSMVIFARSEKASRDLEEVLNIYAADFSYEKFQKLFIGISAAVGAGEK